MKTKYVVFSDLHLHAFNDYAKLTGEYGNTRLENQVKALEDVLKYASYNDAIVLFLGDLYHQRGKVATNVFNAGFDMFNKYRDVTVYALEGNHDNISNSIHSDSSLEPYKALPNFNLIKEYEKFFVRDDTFVGVSYGEEYEELKNFIKDNSGTALLGHLGVEGSYGAGSSKLDGPFTTHDLYAHENYEIVLLGHYHRRQEVSSGVHYVGNPLAQDFGDSEQEKGFYTFDTESGHVVEGSFIFHKLDYPMFYKITQDNIDKYGDKIDELSKDNYVRVILQQSTIDTLKLLDDENMPENVRIEKQVEQTSESRIDISETTTSVDIASKWAEEFQPENKDTIIEQLKKVMP